MPKTGCRKCYVYAIFAAAFPDFQFKRFKMKKNLKILLTCAVFVVVFGCAADGCAQRSGGGYKAVSVSNAAVVEAADVAVTAHNSGGEIVYKLVAVKSAERQTVQGTNYRLCLQIIAEDAELENDYDYVRTVIFRNLQGEFELKTWTETKSCGK